MSISNLDRALGFFKECLNPDCRFRYPDTQYESELSYCPKCGERAKIRSRVSHLKNVIHKKNGSDIRLSVLLDNIRSVYNVGSIFRTCEGLGIKEIFLGGITPTPDHPQLRKTGLGAENQIKWTHNNNSLDLAEIFIREDYLLIGLECSDKSIPIDDLFMDFDTSRKPICLILGNENLGIDPDLQKLCDLLMCIPMQGIKESFNVSVAFAIAAYKFQEYLRTH